METFYGKAVKSLIDWWFDENHQDTRREISKYKISSKEVETDYMVNIVMTGLPIKIAEKRIEHREVSKKFKAINPKVSQKQAWDIFNFLHENSNLTTEKSGMQGYSTGMDKSKLKSIVKDYGLDFFIIKPFIQYYQDKLLEQQNIAFERQSSKT